MYLLYQLVNCTDNTKKDPKVVENYVDAADQCLHNYAIGNRI